MLVTRCARGHFYDGEKFKECPHCQEENEKKLISTGNFFGENDDLSTISLDDEATVSIMSGEGYDPWPVTEPAFPERYGGETIPIPNEADTYGDSEDDRPTAGSFDSTYVNGKEITPCVGWLVCVEGKNRGQDFRLTEGKNYIGRLHSNTICLDGEETVARERHAILVFDAKHNRFKALQGESKELYYVNGNLVLNSLDLKRGDRIEIGKTVLLFIPLCDEDFTWMKEG